MSSTRKQTIYISTEVYQWLWMLTKAERLKQSTITTPDEIADRILRRTIKEEYPGVVGHQKKIDELEKQLIESLKTS